MDLRGLFTRPSIDEVEPDVAQQELIAGTRLIDVREPHEFDAGHAPGAELIPLGQLSSALRDMPASSEILFICRSGNRSAYATEMAARMGMKAKNVRGGIIAWYRGGLPIER